MELWERFWNSFVQSGPVQHMKFHEYDRIGNYFGGNIPEDVTESFFADKYGRRDLVLENLQSHDAKGLVERIKELLGKETIRYVEFPHRTGEKVYIELTIASPELVKSVVSSEKFQKLIKFYNYTLDQVAGSKISLEPNFPKVLDIPDGAWIYHLVWSKAVTGTRPGSISMVDSILKNGLRPKDHNQYRSYGDSKVFGWYFGTTRRFEVLEKLRKGSEELGFEQEHWDKNEVIVLGIRNSRNFKWYQDSAMYSEGACFSYDFIPPQFISKVYPK